MSGAPSATAGGGGSPTEHGAGSGSEGLTLQTLTLQEAAVGRAGVTGEAAAAVQSAQVEEDGALVVTHEVRFTCGGESRP